MNLLKKLANTKTKRQDVRERRDPDNGRLCSLLNIWAQQQSEQSYRDVLHEILNGDGFLLLPSMNDERTSTNWYTTETDSTMQLMSIFESNDLKLLGAFSNEKALISWTKIITDYTAMPTKDLLEFCSVNSIDRVVINSGSKDMFVLHTGRQPASNPS